MSIIYTKEEKEQLNNGVNTIIDDLRRIWSTPERRSKEVVYDCRHVPSRKEVYLYMNDNHIYVNYINANGETLANKIIELRTPFGIIKRKVSPEVAAALIKDYDSIRSFVEEKIARDILEKNKQLRNCAYIEENYSSNVDLELELPPANNRYSIEVSKENGKNIGTLRLSGQTTLRIISNQPIAIVNKYEQEELSTSQTKKR